MSITDELRSIAVKTECASGRCEKLYRGDLEHIADRIDAEHERICYDYRREHDDWVDDRDANYIKLPVDADGVPIRIGDRMEVGEQVFVTGVSEKGFYWLEGTRYKYGRAGDHRHHHEPTVEDVLREFAEKITDSPFLTGNSNQPGTRLSSLYSNPRSCSF